MDIEFTDTLMRRAQAHAALGEPARLAIVDMLVAGDASPGEVGGRLGLATNLVAHHLKVLQDAGLVDRARSEADRRRTYVRLLPQALAGLTPKRALSARRVVFVCTHNSARSQLAAALWAQRSDIPVASAGTAPARRVHPRAVAVAARHGLRLDAAATAHIDAVLQPDDLVVAVCDHAHELLPADPLHRLHWSVRDPAALDTDIAFEDAFNQIAARVERFVPVLPLKGDAHDLH